MTNKSTSRIIESARANVMKFSPHWCDICRSHPWWCYWSTDPEPVNQTTPNGWKTWKTFSALTSSMKSYISITCYRAVTVFTITCCTVLTVFTITYYSVGTAFTIMCYSVRVVLTLGAKTHATSVYTAQNRHGEIRGENKAWIYCISAVQSVSLVRSFMESCWHL